MLVRGEWPCPTHPLSLERTCRPRPLSLVPRSRNSVHSPSPTGTIEAVDPRDAIDPEQLDALSRAFCRAAPCLPGCMRARPPRPVFRIHHRSARRRLAGSRAAARTRARASGLFAQQDQRNALCDEFLDLCSIHGESHPGERKLARMFLERIERGEVGNPTQAEWRGW